MSGLPCTIWARMGKSARTRSTSNAGRAVRRSFVVMLLMVLSPAHLCEARLNGVMPGSPLPVARGGRVGVVDVGEAVHVLLAAGKVEAVDGRLGVLALEANARLVAHEVAAKGEVVRREGAARRDGDLRRRDVVRLPAFLLHLVM